MPELEFVSLNRKAFQIPDHTITFCDGEFSEEKENEADDREPPKMSENRTVTAVAGDGVVMFVTGSIWEHQSDTTVVADVFESVLPHYKVKRTPKRRVVSCRGGH